MEKVNPVEIIIDLYYLRNLSMYPTADTSKVWDRAYYDFNYSALSTAIALIADKYKVKSQDIDEALNKRREQERYENSPLKTL